MDYNKLAQSIIKYVGGDANIDSVTHCITRIRFNLHDDKKADTETIKKLEGVVSVINKGGQYQVVIGPNVEKVYNELIKFVSKTDDSNGPGEKKKTSPINIFFDTIASIFVPIIGALAGAGMLKAILSLATNFNWISAESQTYILLYMISDVVFYFMPIFLAVSASKKFKCNTFVSLIFAGMLVHPTFTALKEVGEAVFLFGIPVRLVTYTTSVIPIILIVLFQSIIEKFVKKHTPDAVKTFLVPVVTILIVAPVGLIVLGPIGTVIGDYVASFFQFLNDRISWLVPMLVGAFNPLLVMTGMHYSVGAAQSLQRATVGYATIYSPGGLASNMAQAASTFAVSLKSKNKDTKALASSCAATAICGITEPSLYGVSMKFKTPLYSAMLAGGIAGLYAGIMGVKAYSAGTSTIFALPIYIGPDNSFMHAIITVCIALICAFVFSYISFKDPKTEGEKAVLDTKEHTDKVVSDTAKNTNKILHTTQIYSPMSGKLVSLEEVPDEAFSNKTLGEGFAIVPESGEVYAPFDGEVEVFSDTKHAIVLKSEKGIEMLIHMGIDTVELNGIHYQAFVKQNDIITQGQKLLSMDLKAITEAGYNTITPVIITGSESNTMPLDDHADVGQLILTLTC